MHVLDQVLHSLTQRLRLSDDAALHYCPHPPGLWLPLFLENSIHFPTQACRNTFNYPPHSASWQTAFSLLSSELPVMLPP